jgi:hypothetical protein
MLSMEEHQVMNLFSGRWMVKDLVLIIHPSIFLLSSDALAMNFFMEIMELCGRGSCLGRGLVIELIAKGAAFAILSMLSLRSGKINIESSI